MLINTTKCSYLIEILHIKHNLENRQGMQFVQYYLLAVIVAQLVERSLPILEVHGSNPVIGKKLFISIEHLFTVNCVLERRK